MMKRFVFGLAVMLSLCGASDASAAFLLTPSAESRVEAWLGRGTWTSPEYSRTPPTSTRPWTARATASLLAAVVGANTYVIGGYDPLSWSSIENFIRTPDAADRTAFIFNLSSGVTRDQNADSTGLYRTEDRNFYGPTFGDGYDLFLDSTRGIGYAYHYSYGGTSHGVNGAVLSTPDYPNPFASVQLEGYTFAPAATAAPAPPGLVLMGLGAVGLIGYRLRGRRGPASA
jgi:hypothetical protein